MKHATSIKAASRKRDRFALWPVSSTPADIGNRQLVRSCFQTNLIPVIRVIHGQVSLFPSFSSVDWRASHVKERKQKATRITKMTKAFSGKLGRF